MPTTVLNAAVSKLHFSEMSHDNDSEITLTTPADVLDANPTQLLVRELRERLLFHHETGCIRMQLGVSRRPGLTFPQWRTRYNVWSSPKSIG